MHTFLGIPFAASPFGELRFLAPHPVEPWDGVRECTTFGVSAPQPSQGFTIIPEPIIPGDECLNVNVFTPTLERDARLPVLVYIHGGGFVNGSNASPWYNGTRFAQDGVVVAVVNYRLGIEGFLPIQGAPTNRAVLDWLAALEWVHLNIDKFGGDASRITIAGQSAGGVACGTLLALPKATGAFERAILMSGVPRRNATEDDGRGFVEELARGLGVAPTVEGLGSVDRARLIEVQQARAPGGTAPRFDPVIDGDLVVDGALKAIARGDGRDVDVLVGSTAEEVDNIGRERFKDVDESRARVTLERMGVPAAAIDHYLTENAGREPWRAIGRAMTDNTFRIGVVRACDARADGGAAANTFAYEFQWRSPTGFGSVHCLDLPFVWDVLDADRVDVVAGDNPPRQLAAGMHRAWVRFITEGDPGWPAYASTADGRDSSRRNVMAFNDPESRLVDDPHRDIRSVFVR